MTAAAVCIGAVSPKADPVWPDPVPFLQTAATGDFASSGRSKVGYGSTGSGQTGSAFGETAPMHTAAAVINKSGANHLANRDFEDLSASDSLIRSKYSRPRSKKPISTILTHWAVHFQKTIHGYLHGREMNEAISGWKQKAAIQEKAGLKTKNQAHPFSLKRINWITSGHW